METIVILWNWLISPTGTAVATWIAGIVAVVGIPITFSQAVKSKEAALGAQTAASAARLAVGSLINRLNIANASYANSQLALLAYMVEHTDYPGAKRHYFALQRTIIHSHGGGSPLPEHVSRAMKGIEEQLLRGIECKADFNKRTLSRAITGLSQHLTLLERDAIHNSEKRRAID